jgi:glutaredoxin 2
MSTAKVINTDKEEQRYALYYFATCPYCIKTRLELALLGIKIPLKNIKRHKEHKTDLVAGGGKKQVPCLRIENIKGQVQWMYESTDIVQYFKNQTQHLNKSIEL